MSFDIRTCDKNSGYGITFSFLPLAGACSEQITPQERANYLGITVMNILGYIPGVSFIVGIARMIFSQLASVYANSRGLEKVSIICNKAMQEAQLVRGALECCSIFAPLMLIGDIATTILILITK